jgi:hypothetical protein
MVTAPPTGNQIRFDAGYPYVAVVTVWIRNITTDGIDVHTGLMNIAADSTIYVQDKNDHTLYAAFETTADPIDHVDHVELPVTWTGNGGTLLNQAIELVVAPPTVSPPTPPTPGPALVTLADAKLHLRIPAATTTYDEDITQKAEEASHIITDYLKSRADPTWTATTVPTPVKAGVLVLLTHLFEHRGDDMDPDEAVWNALERLLMRFRDPALA